MNPAPDQGLSSSLQVGIGALSDDAEAALIALGDQPLLPARAVRALLDAEAQPGRPIVVPVYGDGAGRNPGAAAARCVRAVDQTSRGSRARATRSTPTRSSSTRSRSGSRAATRMWTRGTTSSRCSRRRGPRGSAPMPNRWTGSARCPTAPISTRRSRACSGPTRRGPMNRRFRPCCELVRPGETWLDIGAGAGRYALPIALALAPSGGRVIAVDASPGMLDALMELQAEHGIDRRRGRRDALAAAAHRHARSFRDGRRLDRPRRLRHRGDRPVRPRDGVGRAAAVRRGADGAPALIGRRCLLAPGPWARSGWPLPALPEFVELVAGTRSRSPRRAARPGAASVRLA